MIFIIILFLRFLFDSIFQIIKTGYKNNILFLVQLNRCYLYNLLNIILGLEYGREFPGRDPGGTGWAGRTPYITSPGKEGPLIFGPRGRPGRPVHRGNDVF